MVDIVIDNTPLCVEEGTTVLKAAQSIGIDIPTLCFLEGVDTMGACRVCVVEVEDSPRLEAACNTPVREGMVVHTHSPRVEKARRMNLEIIDSRHDRDCPNCVRNNACKLQDLFLEYNIEKNVYPKQLLKGKRAQWNPQGIIQKDYNKCIMCGRCIEICKNVQGANVWSFTGSGSRTTIGVRDGLSMPNAGCIACGQCITHCPDAALTERDDTQKLLDAIANPAITTVVQIAPAVRSAWASTLGVADGELTVERMASALHKLGVDYVFDTVFSADLTIMEEGTELLQTLANNNTEHLPMFTSCCPGWTAHVRRKHPELLGHLSSAKSPMMMFGAVVKGWWAQQKGLKPENVFSVAIMPCTAKKMEVGLEGGQSNPGIPDMDLSLTTREFVRMIENANIDVTTLEDSPLDSPLDEGTGAGVIFGTTGGVMEAALRSAYALTVGKNPEPKAFTFTDTNKGWREAEFDLAGTKLRCAVVDGLVNADKLIAALENKTAQYDFIEVMACPSGCAGGGGQPIDGSDRELGLKRGQVLLDIDEQDSPIRFSHENSEVQALYTEWLDAPYSEKAEHFLHVDHFKVKEAEAKKLFIR